MIIYALTVYGTALSTTAETLGDRVEHAIEAHTDGRDRDRRRSRRAACGRTIFWLAVTGVSIYLVFPSIVEVFGSWRRHHALLAARRWPAMAGLQAASLACLWALQYVALRGARWRAGDHARSSPATRWRRSRPAAARWARRCSTRCSSAPGSPPAATVTALTAVNVLVFAVVLAMPVLAIPALLRGGVNDTLLDTALAGLGVFVVGLRRSARCC